MEAIQYNLKDIELLNSDKEKDFCVYIPNKTYVVLGRSNSFESDVHIENVCSDNVSVLKRPSGGETVILSDKTIVMAIKIDNCKQSHALFKTINSNIIDTLKSLGIENLKSNGISDISIGEKKILGSSMYKQKDTLFYHAVLNHSENIDTISHYIKHPKREPDYRKGRSHNEFVTSLQKEGCSMNIVQIKELLSECINKFIRE